LTVADKIVSGLYGESGSIKFRHGFFNQILNFIDQLIPHSDFKKDRITYNTRYGEYVVKSILKKEGIDNIESLNKEIRKIVKDVFTSLTLEAMALNKIKKTTVAEDDNYYGWHYFVDDETTSTDIHKTAKLIILKIIKKNLKF